MLTAEQLVTAVAASTDQLASRIAQLGDSEVRAPCCTLPGWSSRPPPDPSGEKRRRTTTSHSVLSGRAKRSRCTRRRASRDADIDAGAARPARVIIDDFALSARALATEVRLVTPDQWRSSTQLSTVTGRIDSARPIASRDAAARGRDSPRRPRQSATTSLRPPQRPSTR